MRDSHPYPQKLIQMICKSLKIYQTHPAFDWNIKTRKKKESRKTYKKKREEIFVKKQKENVRIIFFGGTENVRLYQ